MTIKTSSAKAKGRKLQQWCAARVFAFFPDLEPEDAVSTPMRSFGGDVRLSPRARRLLGVTVEAKARASVAVYGWYDQATRKDHGKPVLIVKAVRRKPLAVVDADCFFALLATTSGRQSFRLVRRLAREGLFQRLEHDATNREFVHRRLVLDELFEDIQHHRSCHGKLMRWTQDWHATSPSYSSSHYSLAQPHDVGVVGLTGARVLLRLPFGDGLRRGKTD